MRIVKLSAFFLLCASLVLTSGCGQELKDLKIQNDTQRKRIAELESELQAAKLRLEQLKRQLDATQDRSGVKADTLRQKIAALEEDLNKKKALIASMQKHLIGGVTLPVELSTMLEDFANSQDMVTYDPDRGVVKFESDLLFKSGSDVVLPVAAKAVKSLCKIMNSEQGREFDIIIAGHTDDQPIRYSRPRHPTNWHLSAHRAISVLNIMTGSDVAPERVSIRGFGEFRPVSPNKPDKKGNSLNRRVEIYIVPKGM